MFKLPTLFDWSEIDPMPEGPMAHEISDKNLRQLITENYNKMYKPAKTPYTHPQNYDPLNPPKGWAFDPYYEIWIQLNE